MASIKGKLFEFFVYRLLVTCGFKPVIPDGDWCIMVDRV